MKKNGVKVISAKETIGEGSEGILLDSVLEGMAEFYSAELAEKVSRGMTENVLKGLCNGGQVTFGYKVNAEHCYEKDELTSPIVEQIFEMYSDGYKIKEIVDYLNEHNIRTYRNGKMTINIVQRMLSNCRYTGEYKFQKAVVPNGIPAIISEGLFNRVQEILAKNKRSPARKKAEDEYLLTLKLFCGKCSAHMVGESGTGTSRVYRYYKCANTKKVHMCDKKPVRKEWIEDLAVKAALDILQNNEVIDYLTDKIYALQGEENPRIPKLKEQLADVEKRLANIMQAIEQGIIFDTTKEGKQRLIEGFINAIYVYDDKITFAFNFKDGTRTVMLSELTDGKNNSDLKCQGAPRKRTGRLPVLFRGALSERSRYAATCCRRSSICRKANSCRGTPACGKRQYSENSKCKSVADCLSFFVVRYPSEVVTRQPVAVVHLFSMFCNVSLISAYQFL